MSVGPLRRLVGMLGLMSLIPTAMMLGLGRVTPGTAAMRAVATLVATMIIGRAAGWWVRSMARGYEEDGPTDATEALGIGAAPGRRREDQAVPAR